MPAKTDAGEMSGKVSGLTLLGQGESNWCWAAVVQALLATYRGQVVSQEALITAHLQRTGRTYSCQPDNRRRADGGSCTGTSCTASCNDEHSIKAVLQENGLHQGSLSSDEAPGFDQIRQEIAANRAIVARVKWISGEGHVILVNGWFETSGGKKGVFVLDPQAAGDGIQVQEKRMSYSAFATAYQQNGKVGAVDKSYKVG